MPQKAKTIFVCSECGSEHSKWSGMCSTCNSWNCLQETQVLPAKTSVASKPVTSLKAISIKDVDASLEQRLDSGINEFNRVLGGGIVEGSVVLLSGDPGIGKSTILLQVCGNKNLGSILYISGEESANQIKLRAKRLNVDNPKLTIMPEVDVLSICSYIKQNQPEIVVVDSIQTMVHDAVVSSAGSISQVRECTSLLQRVAKETGVSVFIVGHINKGGDIAGPKVLEHIVDTVLYFEGERNNSYRILRAQKNRFGSTNEIGVFDMGENGLSEVENPSSMLLSGRISGVSGSCVTSIMEGSRPLFAEVQGLVSTTVFGNPRRMATGFDYNRLNLLLAVLEKRIGLVYSNIDAYLNVVGGLKLDEPAGDLSVTMALVSALRDKALPDDLCVFGEVGLAGEIRSVPFALQRTTEAKRLGFAKCILPKGCKKQLASKEPDGIELLYAGSLKKAVEFVKQ